MGRSRPNHQIFVINRGRDAELAKYLEDRGVFVSNPSLVNGIANDKYLTYLKLSPLVPMLETHLLTENEPPLPFPFVAKPAAGHGGAGVTMIKSAGELQKYRAEHGEKSVIQPLASEPPRDMRVYVIGGEPVCAMLRESKTDFRSNFSLGGSARLIPARSRVRISPLLIYKRQGFILAFCILMGIDENSF